MLHPLEQGERKSVSQEWTADVFSTIEKEHTEPAGDGVDESFRVTPFPGSAGCERSTGGEGGGGVTLWGPPAGGPQSELDRCPIIKEVNLDSTWQRGSAACCHNRRYLSPCQ